MARMKFICDANRCIECNGCVTACKNANDVPWGVNRSAGGTSRVSVTSCGSAALPRNTTSVTAVPGAPCSCRMPSHTDMSRVGAVPIIRMKSPGRSPAFAAGECSRAAMTRR